MTTGFVLDDLEFCRDHFNVVSYFGDGWLAPIHVFFRSLGADLSLSWFGSVYSFFMVMGSRLTGMKSVIMIGGVDAAKMSHLSYGVWTTPWKAALLKKALLNCTSILVVDESLKHDLQALTGDTLDHAEVLPTGFDPTFWKPGGLREIDVLCVAAVDTGAKLVIKGIPALVESARRMPDVRFMTIGVQSHLVKNLRAPENMIFVEPIARTALLDYYRRSKVYCQPSLREGLPNALCEAMLCGCIPVGTSVGGIPKIIGETGFLTYPDDAPGLSAAIRKALESTDQQSERARARIEELFSKTGRNERFLAILNSLL